jgi:hypothetical protein
MIEYSRDTRERSGHVRQTVRTLAIEKTCVRRHKWNSNESVVERKGVANQIRFSQVLSMVRSHNDHCVLEQPCFFQHLKDARKPVVHIPDGSAIQVPHASHSIRRNYVGAQTDGKYLCEREMLARVLACPQPVHYG